MESRRTASSAEHDRDLEHRVKNYLFGHKLPALRSVDVDASGDVVVLHGRVDSFYQKQLCLHCCHRVAGVRDVVDQIAVAPAARGPSPTSPREPGDMRPGQTERAGGPSQHPDKPR